MSVSFIEGNHKYLEESVYVERRRMLDEVK